MNSNFFIENKGKQRLNEYSDNSSKGDYFKKNIIKFDFKRMELFLLEIIESKPFVFAHPAQKKHTVYNLKMNITNPEWCFDPSNERKKLLKRSSFDQLILLESMFKSFKRSDYPKLADNRRCLKYIFDRFETEYNSDEFKKYVNKLTNILNPNSKEPFFKCVKTTVKKFIRVQHEKFAFYRDTTYLSECVYWMEFLKGPITLVQASFVVWVSSGRSKFNMNELSDLFAIAYS